MHISIPKPCNENWNEMTPEQQGAFCKVCSKVVIDFSAMSDEEVIAYLERKKNEKTCGRFKASQLSPYELKINVRNIVTKGSFPKIFAASLFIFFSSLFVCKSDSGDNIVFNKLVADGVDTTSVTLVADTTIASVDTTGAIEEIHPEDFIKMGEVDGGATLPATIDTSVITLDTVVIDFPVMGIIAVPEPEPMIMGRIACPRPEKTKEETIKKETKREKKKNSNKEIMGDIAF